MSYYTLNDGDKIYYEDKGHGKNTLIMMHGWTSSHNIYEKPTETLKEYARCIIYDHRGHGKSKNVNNKNPDMETLARDLNELIQGLALSDITLLGWSMGAGVALNYVKLYGCDALKQIILCDMTPKQINDEEWKLGLYQGRYTNEDMERDMKKRFYSLYKEFAVAAVPKLKKIPGFLLRKPLKKILAECDESVLKSLAISMKSQDNRPIAEQITVPFTYFYADPGSLFTPELSEWYKEHIPTKYKAVRFPESTHMLISDYPEKFTKEVITVLRN